MDFVRLGRNEIRRNWTRTIVALAAAALAAWILVVPHMIPEGYPWGVAQAERAFVGADLVVWPLGSPVRTESSGPLAQNPWEGRDWQSHVLHFLPGLPSEGFLSEPGSSWRGFPAEDVLQAIRRVPGVSSVAPYVAIPCLYGGEMAILRVRDPIEGETYPLSMDRFVKDGRLPGTGMEALFPDFGKFQSGSPGSLAQITVPGIVVPETGSQIGLDWDKAVSVQLEISGHYRVDTNEVLSLHATGPKEDSGVMGRTVWWDRPEIVVTSETFAAIQKDAMDAIQKGDLPVYQLGISLERMSLANKVKSRVAEIMGPGFAVFVVPELQKGSTNVSAFRFEGADAGPFVEALSFVLAATTVAGSVFIMASQQRKKIGLLRVIGAKRRDIVLYILTIVSYVAVFGSLIGFACAKTLSIWSLFASELTLGEWLFHSFLDLLKTLCMSLGISLFLGFSVAFWASRIPSAEVLKRE